MIPLHGETLLSTFGVTGQGAVGKAERVGWPSIVNHVHNAASIHDPETPDVREHGDGGSL